MNNTAAMVSRYFLGSKEQAMGSWMIAGPQIDKSPAAPTGIRRFNTYLMSERRRIVAQVRREVPKDRDFLAVQIRCRGATTCYRQPLTMPIGRASKPPT